jgi:acyl-CoA thioester hydrolase
MEEAGVLLPVARVEVEYRNGVGYDEPVEIRTRVEEVRSRSVTFAYEALDVHGGTTLARGRTVLVCTGSDGHPRRIPERAVAVLRQLRDASRE